MLIVQLGDFGDDGDAVYRIQGPSQALADNHDVTVVDCHFASHAAREWALEADLLVLQFFNEWDLLSLCQTRRRRGKATVFEANDYFFDLQPWSPIGAAWQNREVQQLYCQLLTATDGVQTSSARLAEHWKRYGARDVAVFRNQLAGIDPLPRRTPGPVTVGWAGSPGHFADWYAFAPVVQAWLDQHEDVHLAVMTHPVARDFFSLPPERYHFSDFGSLDQYLAFLDRVDIGIAPLLATEYNRCRSDVKFLEYASRGVAGVYSDSDPYRDVIGASGGGLLFSTAAELTAALDDLYRHPGKRQELVQRGYEYVAQNRLLTDNIVERLSWYRSLTGVEPGSSQGQYRQIRLEPKELTARQLSTVASAEGKRAALADLLVSWPDFLVALQDLGRLCNDQGDTASAFDYLRRAAELEPESARTHCELGRTLFLRGDVQRAVHHLAHAIELCEEYLPAWQYLLRLNAITPTSDVESWASRAISLFPDCYPLVCLACEVLEPERAAQEVLDLLGKVGPTLTVLERPAALAEFRKTITGLVSTTPATDLTLDVLRQACGVFPESAALAGLRGEALISSGQYTLGFDQLSRAAQLHAGSLAVRAEFQDEVELPWRWRFADHIHAVRGEPPSL